MQLKGHTNLNSGPELELFGLTYFKYAVGKTE